MYELNGDIKSFAVANDFTTTMSKVAYKWGTTLTPFCIFADEFQSAKGVIDITTFGGLQNGNKTLLDEIYEARVEALNKDGVQIPSDADKDLVKRTLFMQYLLTVSVCYVEIEKWKTVYGQAQKTYDKCLCTRNPRLMAAWMGANADEMSAKYSAKLRINPFEYKDGVLRFVKLNSSAKGNSITMPRGQFDSKTIKCVPLFMLYAQTQGIKSVLNDGIVKFTFLKDNHTEREMVSTLNEGILREFYPDQLFLSTMLGCVDIETVKQGGMMLPSKIHRGYIKIPELGASKFDATGVRSLNVARILEMKPMSKDEVDTTYIDVDLGSVTALFQDNIEYALKHSPDSLSDIYEVVTGEKSDASASGIVDALVEYVKGQEVLLSTTYQRNLHKLMIGNPHLFPRYTGGIKKEVTAEVKNYGVVPLDF